VPSKVAAAANPLAALYARGLARPFRHRLRVRYAECDPQGVVFNAHYVAWFDLVMTELWRGLPGGYAGMTERGSDMVVAEVRVRYLEPARFDDVLDLEAAVVRLGTTGLTTAISVICEGRTLAEGELRHVFVDLGSHRKAPIPDDVRGLLERYLQPGLGSPA